jgi:steroid 5-alpha reductase family enzyme
MTPLHLVINVALVFCAIAWVASLVTGDTSWVDRLWSIVPVVYVGLYAYRANWHDARLNLMAACVFVWGARLTFNFARKGGYSGTEDYRWEVLRGRMNKWQFQLFNLFFIVLYQNFILVLIALPAQLAYDNRVSFGFVDILFAVVFLLMTLGEFVADQQQWNFYKKREAKETTAKFNTHGLFAYSRHPNYFFELAQWWVLYAYAAYTAASVFNWEIAGVVLLTTLFAGSTKFTEDITLGKYPEYSQYQKRVKPVIPWVYKR